MQLQEQHLDATLNPVPGAPLWRRLLAILYDTMVLVCVIFIAWQPVPLLPLDQLPPLVSQALRLAYLFSITFLFFGWFWTHGGQTIGMRAWQLKLLSTATGASPGWRQCWIRYIVAIVSWMAFGLGYLSALFNSRNAAWHDLASATQLVVAPRKS